MDRRTAAALLGLALTLGFFLCVGTTLLDRRPTPPTPIPTRPFVFLSPAPASPPAAGPALLPTAAPPEPFACPTPTRRPWPGLPGGGGMSCEEALRLGAIGPPPPSAAIAALDARARDGIVELRWPDTGQPEAAYYAVYRQAAGAEGWQLLAWVLAPRRVGGDGALACLWRDEAAVPGTTYRYGVAAGDAYAQIGPVRTSAPVTAP